MAVLKDSSMRPPGTIRFSVTIYCRRYLPIPDMPKRKRVEFEDSNPTNPDKSECKIQRKQLQLEIDHGCRILYRALKIARGFERQKLGRRQKSAREKQEDTRLARLEVEVQALKVQRSFKLALNHSY